MDKLERYEIRLSGSGGQGLITAGMILAHAAILDGKNAVQTQVYGPESRGGACRSEVILAIDEIDYPQVTTPDLVFVMNQESYNKFRSDIKPGGYLFVDSSEIVETQGQDGVHVFSSPITNVVRERLEKIVVANITALAYLNEIAELVAQENLLKAILSRIPEKFAKLNTDAFELGRELARTKVVK